MINLAIPVLNNYIGLKELIYSAEKGRAVPDAYYIMDNGLKFCKDDYDDFGGRIKVFRPDSNLGVAASWNFFIHNVPEERIISNDDIIFYDDTIEKLVNTPGDLVYCGGISSLNMFSLFLFRDSLMDKIGTFNEDYIYGYYEDNDFRRRMLLANVEPAEANCDAIHAHGGSQTLKHYTKDELEEHHKLFRRNTTLYKLMWGGLPSEEIFKIPFNGRGREWALDLVRREHGR